MQVKRFVAATMRLALKQVREEIGPDAVILSNKRVPGGVELLTAIEEGSLVDELQPDRTQPQTNKQDNPFAEAVKATSGLATPEAFIEKPSKLELELEQVQRDNQQRARMIAASLAEKNTEQIEQVINSDKISSSTMEASSFTEQLEPDVVDFKSVIKAVNEEQATAENSSKVGVAQVVVDNTNVVSTADDSALSQMRFEMQSMRDLLEMQLANSAWGNYTQQFPQQAGLWKRLTRMGIGGCLAEQLLTIQKNDNASQPETDVWQALLAEFKQQLPTVEGDLIDKGGCFAFVGPTGAGKTTTIGKLATRYVLKHGAESVALVTTDTQRIAATEQLRTFGRILNVPVKQIDKNNSLEQVLHSVRHKSLVLIDTAGLNGQDPKLRQQLNCLNELGRRIKTLLVLPTTSQLAVIKAAYHSYKTDNLSACVLTKLDETANLGEVLTLTIEKNLPLAYCSEGQSIPTDIAKADADLLVRQCINLAKKTTIDNDFMAAEFSIAGQVEPIRAVQ